MLLILENNCPDSLGEQVHAIKGTSANLCMTEAN